MESGWPVVIIVLVVAMAVGPVMLMQPSGRQRRLAKLRQNALSEGLLVSVAHWPDKAGERPKGIMRYSLPWAAEDRHDVKMLLVRKNYQHELHLAGVWQKYPDKVNVNVLTRRFLVDNPVPASIYALGFDGSGAFADWSEQTSSDLPVIKDLLSRLRASAG